jgi:hypothetical protein
MGTRRFRPLALARGHQLNATTFFAKSYSISYAPFSTLFIEFSQTFIMSNYFEEEECLQEALLYKEAHPNTSLQFLSRQFSVLKDQIRC